MKKWLFILMLSLVAPEVIAQGCAICTKTASQQGEKTAKGINGGIVYLAVFPLSILGTVGFLWWRNNRHQS